MTPGPPDTLLPTRSPLQPEIPSIFPFFLKASLGRDICLRGERCCFRRTVGPAVTLPQRGKGRRVRLRSAWSSETAGSAGLRGERVLLRSWRTPRPRGGAGGKESGGADPPAPHLRPRAAPGAREEGGGRVSAWPVGHLPGVQQETPPATRGGEGGPDRAPPRGAVWLPRRLWSGRGGGG